MRLLSTVSLFYTVFVFIAASFAVPAIDQSTKYTISRDTLKERSPSEEHISSSSLSRRDHGFIDLNSKWRTHYTTITVGVPVTAAAATCNKFLRFIIQVYVPKYQARAKEYTLPIITESFQMVFASTQVIDWADLASYAEALLHSPIANQMAGLWEVGWLLSSNKL